MTYCLQSIVSYYVTVDGDRTIVSLSYANDVRDCHHEANTATSQLPSSVSGTVDWNIRDDTNNYNSTTCHMHKRYVCPFCKKVYAPKNLLKKHIQMGCKMNPRNTQFACTFCPYKSMYKANMERHVRNVHNTGDHKFRCELCNFRSNYSFCVRRHIRTFHRAIADESKQ